EKHPRARFGRGIQRVPISGVVFDPGQAPANQDHFIYAYTDQETYAQLSGEPVNQRLLVRLHDVQKKAQVEHIVGQLVRELASQGVVIDKVSIPEPNAHPHQWQLDTLLLLQGSISLLAFAMAAVLLSQLMASILAKQVRQISILKAIGASRPKVLGIYATMVLTLGAIATLVGVPLAVASGYGFAYFVARILNFAVLTTTLPWWWLTVLVALSLLLPLALSLPVLLRGTRISVHEALSDYGVAAPLADSNAISRLERLPPTLAMALRNALRRRRRLAVTVLTMTLGVAMFGAGFNVRQSLASLLQATSDSMRYDLRVVLRAPISLSRAEELFAPVANIRRLEAWSGGRGMVQSGLLASSSGIGLIALPPETALLRPKVVAGRWLQGDDRPEMVMNLQAWEAYDSLAVGNRQSIVLGGQQVELTLVGLVEEFDTSKIYLDRRYYDRLLNPQELRNSFLLAATDNDYAAVIALKHDVERVLASTDLQVIEVMSHTERMKIIYDHLDIILSVILFLAFTVLLVSAMGMASAVGISIMERTREIGVLRAIGATPTIIARLFVTEGMLISVVSVLLGLLLSWPLSIAATKLFGNLMLGGADLRFVVSAHGVWITLVATLVFGFLASRIPARAATRVSTQEALSYE
ncbi:MAG: FtsX-like permease family protein, partial [Myxococcota bacterium]